VDLGALIAGVGTIAGSLGGALGWLGGRRKSNAEAARVDAEARASEWQAIIASLRAQSDRDREQHSRLVAQLQATIASQAQGLASWSALYQRTKSEVVDEQRRASAAERDRAELERQILEMAGTLAGYRERIRALEAGLSPPAGETTADVPISRRSSAPTGPTPAPSKKR
jgi:chromosome segregation ATPase